MKRGQRKQEVCKPKHLAVFDWQWLSVGIDSWYIHDWQKVQPIKMLVVESNRAAVTTGKDGRVPRLPVVLSLAVALRDLCWTILLLQSNSFQNRIDLFFVIQELTSEFSKESWVNLSSYHSIINWISAPSSNLRCTSTKCELGLCLRARSRTIPKQKLKRMNQINWVKKGWGSPVQRQKWFISFSPCVFVFVCISLSTPPSLSHLLFSSRIMVFVVLSLILSWASLGAGTATAVVRKQCLFFGFNTSLKSFHTYLFFYLFIVDLTGRCAELGLVSRSQISELSSYLWP